MEVELTQVSVVKMNVESAYRPMVNRGTFNLLQDDAEIGPTASSVGNGSPLQLRKHAPQDRIVIAGHHHPIKRHTVHEVEECALDVAHVAIAVHVLGVDFGYNRQNRRELEKGT